MKSSLRFLLKAVLGVAFIILIVVIFLSLSTLSRQIETQFKHDADEKTELAAKIIGNSLVISDFHEIQKTVQTFSANSRVIDIQVLNRYGDALAEAKSQQKSTFKKIYLSEIGIRNEQTGNVTIGTVKVKYSYDYLNSLFLVHFVIVFGAILSLFGALLWALVFSLKSFIRYLSTLMEQFQKVVEHKESSMKMFEWIEEFLAVSKGFDEISTKMAKFRENERQQIQYKVIGQLSAQVAHDIRSPLAALDNVMASVTAIPEDDRILVRTAINRIKDIANNLIEKNRELSSAQKDSPLNQAALETPVTQLLSSLVDPLITEKRMQFRSKIGIEIDSRLDASSYGLFAKIQPTEFKRVLSNLVNNAVEALGDKGTVNICLEGKNNGIEIRVIDNGNGITPEILAKLGQRGETHGKSGGSGLGLYHARTSVESWGGKFKIESEIGRGTSIIITIPQAKAPEWFVSELKLAPRSSVVVLDDDSSIHGIWQGRFESLRTNEKEIEIVHLSTPNEFREWVTNNKESTKTATFLADYELLGFKETGLDLINELNLGTQSILVTSRFEETNIREACERLKVRLIPKGLAGYVPILFQGPLEKPDYILIDDDDLVHMNWQYCAKRDGKTVTGFKTPAEFQAQAGRFDKHTRIYIDSNLGNGIKGEEIAKQLVTLGFTEIWLCTGNEPENYAHLTYLKGCISKEVPW